MLTSFDSETEDNDNMHSTLTNTSRIICQTTGMFKLTGSAAWAAGTAGIRALQIRLNSGGAVGGGTFIVLRQAAGPATSLAISTPEVNIPYRFVNVGDYIEMFVEQTAGSISTVGGATGTYLSALWEIA